jgi:hypothetical protein
MKIFDKIGEVLLINEFLKLWEIFNVRIDNVRSSLIVDFIGKETSLKTIVVGELREFEFGQSRV